MEREAWHAENVTADGNHHFCARCNHHVAHCERESLGHTYGRSIVAERILGLGDAHGEMVPAPAADALQRLARLRTEHHLTGTVDSRRHFLNLCLYAVAQFIHILYSL